MFRVFKITPTPENLMKEQILKFVRANDLICGFQSGFRSGYRTATALLKVKTDIYKALEKELTTILLRSYLSERSWTGCIGGVYSGIRLLSKWVPQGTILGPVLFSSR